MLIPYHAQKNDKKDVTPYFETEYFAVVPGLSVNDGSVLAGRITVIHKNTGYALFNAMSDNLSYLQSVCIDMQMQFPLLGRCQNISSAKKYIKRTREGIVFSLYAHKVNARIIFGV